VLPRRNRLRREKDFRATYSGGRRYDLPSMVLYVRANGEETVRIGFTVGRKVGSAVVRNRVKRLLRESCREILSTLRPGFDGVFVARASSRGMALPEVRRLVASLFQKAGMVVESGSRGNALPEDLRECGGSSSA